MSQSPGRSKQERGADQRYQLFLSFSERTRDFFITILRKRDGMDFEDYLMAVEERIKGSRFVWRGLFKAASEGLSVKLAVSMDEKKIDTPIEEDQDGTNPFYVNLKSGSVEHQEQEDQDGTNPFYVNLKSGSVEHQEQFDKEKIEEINFGESRRFPLISNWNASRVNLELTVKDGKYPVLVEKSIFVDLMDLMKKPNGEKSAVENPH